jgi:hypothetical protein
MSFYINDIIPIIGKYFIEPKYSEFKNFIAPNSISNVRLCQNLNAIHLLEQNINKINWTYLSENTNGITLLEKNIDKINWGQFCFNPNAIDLLE